MKFNTVAKALLSAGAIVMTVGCTSTPNGTPLCSGIDASGRAVDCTSTSPGANPCAAKQTKNNPCAAK